jgi:hypothetical protein
MVNLDSLDFMVVQYPMFNGPMQEECDASRYSTYIQRALNTDWKKGHGIKYLTLEGPNGLCLFMFGPTSCKDPDNQLLVNSNLNQVLARSQVGLDHEDYATYGDGIFLIQSHTIGKHRSGVLSPDEREENRTMTCLRVSNEWAYAATANQFQYVKDRYSSKLLRSDSWLYHYFIATILRNAHLCLYEGETSQRFDCHPPSLEEYFGFE